MTFSRRRTFPPGARSRKAIDLTAPDIDPEIIDFIRSPSETGFNTLALKIFAGQFEHNPAYRRFCERTWAVPGQVTAWEDIPAVPAAAFKFEGAPFCAFDPAKTTRVFESSGTTGGQTSRHHFDTLNLYDASALPNFQRHFLPDGGKSPHMPMRMLLPTPAESPRSSLVYMCQIAGEALADGVDWYVRGGNLDAARLIEDLGRAVSDGRPQALLGTSFAFVHLFDALQACGRRLKLPAGSRMMETGGYKGRARELTKAEFDDLAERLLNIPSGWIVNEYGMTELSSQFYDDVLVRTGDAKTPPVKIAPPWTRVRIIDPKTMTDARPGEIGLIRVLDLANRGSAVAFQTQDIGTIERTGFRVLGRAGGSDLRGCSLAAEDLIREPA